MNNTTLRFINLQNRLNSTQFNKLWYLDIFDDKTKEKMIMAEMPDHEEYLARKAKVVSSRGDAPLESLFMFQEPFLNKAQEQHLFRKYNFLKHKYVETAKMAPSEKAIAQLENYYIQMGEVKTKLVCSNARLVVSLVKKCNAFDRHTSASDGYTGLTMAVDYFDFRYGVKFITYAYRVIKDQILKCQLKEIKNFAYTNGDEVMDNFWDVPDKIDTEAIINENDIKNKIQETLSYATPRERQVISFYYGLNCPEHTLDEIGKKLRITKERVRQIKIQGIERIKRNGLHLWEATTGN